MHKILLIGTLKSEYSYALYCCKSPYGAVQVPPLTQSNDTTQRAKCPIERFVVRIERSVVAFGRTVVANATTVRPIATTLRSKPKQCS